MLGSWEHSKYGWEITSLFIKYKKVFELYTWSSNNFKVTNAIDYHFFVNTNKNITLTIKYEAIKSSKLEFFLGIPVDNKETFEHLVAKHCKKAGQKLHTLSKFYGHE